MRRTLLLIGVLALTMLATGPAWAKGPTGVEITGPGISEPIELEGDGEMGSGGEFSTFVETAGFWQLVYDVDPPVLAGGQVLDGPPAELGPRYTLTWHLGADNVATDLYPDAAGGPVLHLAAQRLEFLDHNAPERWLAADPALLTMLEGYGVPLQPTPAPPAPAPEGPAQAPEDIVAPAGAGVPAAATDQAPWAIWIAGSLAAIATAVVLARRRTGAA